MSCDCPDSRNTDEWPKTSGSPCSMTSLQRGTLQSKFLLHVSKGRGKGRHGRPVPKNSTRDELKGPV